jgi:hypothetical protein
MPFDVNKFSAQNFRHRTEAIPVPDLKQFFGPDDEPVWVVRGLSGEELTRSHEAQAKNRNIAGLVEAIQKNPSPEKVEAMRELLGVGCSVPDELAKRIDMLASGSVEPQIDQPLAVKLAQFFPVEFYRLTNRITALTGLGAEPGKPRPSTATTGSKSP